MSDDKARTSPVAAGRSCRQCPAEASPRGAGAVADVAYQAAALQLLLVTAGLLVRVGPAGAKRRQRQS